MTQKALAPVPARKDETIVETFHGVTVADPYRWMEDPEADETKAFVRAQNERTKNGLAAQQTYIADQVTQMEALMNYPRKSAPSHYGKYWFRDFNPGLAPQSVTQVAESPNGPWRTILDPLAIDASGVTSISEMSITEDGSRIAYTTSVGGDDMVTLHFMETATGAHLADKIENCRWPDVKWDRDNQGFHYSHSPEDGTKRRVLKYHKLGTPVADDKIVFAHEHAESIAHFERRRESGIELVNMRIGTDKNNGYAFRRSADEEFKIIIEPTSESIQIIDLIGNEIYAVSNRDNSRGELVKFTVDEPNKRTVVVPAEAEAVLDSAFLRKGRLLLSYSDDTADRVDIRTPDGAFVDRMPLPAQSTVSFTHDNRDDDGCYVTIGGWLSAGTKYFYNYLKNDLTLFEKSDCPLSLEDCTLERVRVPSKDGTLIPMTVIYDPSVVKDGTAAARVYGYGGFNVPLPPSFSPLRIGMWVKQGGIFAVANIRGGGEFGSDWYDGGRLRNKMHTFEDFGACGQWLIDNSYTSRERICCEGGSNGGLTVCATMQTQDVYGAIIGHVGVLDMLRYDLHTYGAYWKSDYGDPKVNAEDFAVTMQYSPLHTIEAGRLYAPHLLLTAEKDTRVVPMHSLKYAATMQALADPRTRSYLRVEVDAGHGAGTALQKSIAEHALINGFCREEMGPINQAEYRRSLTAPTPEVPNNNACTIKG